MILSSTSHWTHRCPLSRLNGVRWTMGMVSATLWFRASFAALSRDVMLWTLLAAVITTQMFGTLSAGMLMLRPRLGVLNRLTDWYAIVASVMTWVLGVGAILCNEFTWAHIALLLGAVAMGVTWLMMIYFGLRPIHLGATKRE